ncbi:hypothetical protein C0Q70_10256 [Pomacea canaliculata]|uniref:acid phosphatase n=1 Tax=Pomacea canaliculata TaxID=400727 RepID=A0A2T7PC40_POMCA|nr:hypothetical protein C0Q70_10256 [Pomacea canaliculata]
MTAALAAAPDTLRLVNVLYRHGDRSPVSIYPKDPYQADVWPQGLGWLTEIGMQQHFKLGQFLRSEYRNLLNSTYVNSEIHIESSDEDRCLMSAYCNLAGLYPPAGSQVWNPNITWQPIPVHAVPKFEDNKLNMGAACPQYNQLYDLKLQSPDVKKIEKENAKFFDFIEKQTGVKKENATEVWKIGDTLFCEKSHNMMLPNWTEEIWNSKTAYENLRSLQIWSFILQYNDTNLNRLKGGPLLKEFISNMEKTVSSPANQTYKVFMYSAHDSTIAAVTSAMKVFNFLNPPYAAALFVELHQIGDQYFVWLRYYNDSGAPYNLTHPDCGLTLCPLEKFIDVTKDHIPDNWHAECFGTEKSTVSGTVI